MRLNLFFFVLTFTGATAFSTDVYMWRDEQGRLHYSDTKPDSKVVKKVSPSEAKTVGWQKTPDVAPLPKAKAVKGIRYLSKRQQRCQYLDRKIKYYEDKARNSRRSEKFRQKKREYRWLKQKEC